MTYDRPCRYCVHFDKDKCKVDNSKKDEIDRCNVFRFGVHCYYPKPKQVK